MIQVAEQDFNIDPDFFNMLIERSKTKIEERLEINMKIAPTVCLNY